MSKHELLLLDMDWTITLSWQVIDLEMVNILSLLSKKYKIGIVSWASFKKINYQIIRFLNKLNVNLKNLYILSSQWWILHIYSDNEWNEIYKHFLISDQEYEFVKEVINKIWFDFKVYWNIFEYKHSQISYFVIWDKTPYEIALRFDPSGRKRLKIIEILKKKLSNYYFSIWWLITIDIVKKWLDKSFWINEFLRYTWINKDKVLYIWDSFFKWWNDFPVKKLWIDIIEVNSIENTKKVLTNDLL